MGLGRRRVERTTALPLLKRDECEWRPDMRLAVNGLSIRLLSQLYEDTFDSQQARLPTRQAPKRVRHVRMGLADWQEGTKGGSMEGGAGARPT